MKTSEPQNLNQPGNLAQPEEIISLRYVLITPARDEAKLIGNTIKSVIAQTTKPVRWLIVSDGSTDGTDEIVKKFAAEHSWIELIRMPERSARHFGGKANAFMAGYAKIHELDFQIVGNLDADITFDEDYYSFLLHKFHVNPRLGVAGTPFLEDNRTYDYRFTSLDHVSGGCQLFRRECFDSIGGYRPLKSGGIDLMAVLTARFMGWQTQSFLGKSYNHHRKMGTAVRNGLALKFHDGRGEYLLGVHPLWEIGRAAYHLRKSPYLLGGTCLLLGYFWAMFSRQPRSAPKEIIQFRHKEQLARLRLIARRFLSFDKGVVSRPGPGQKGA